MQVLHLCAGNMFGGVERLLLTLANQRQLCPEMKPWFAPCFEGRLAVELREQSVPVSLLGAVRFSRPWSLWGARRRLRQLLSHESFDVAVCHSAWPHACFAPVLESAGVPNVYVAHDLPHGGHWIERKASRTEPALVLANSRCTQQAIPLLFKARSVVWNYPVAEADPADRGSRAQIRESFHAPDDAVVIVMVCRLERYKGHTLLLEALGKLKTSQPWRCWIVGGVQKPADEVYLGELREQAAQLGISDNVLFAGQRSDVGKIMAAADLHCQPNVGPEPFGIAFIEALYAGLPLVTTRMGGGEEIVTPACGILVPPGDAAALATALAGLMEDAPRRAAMAVEAPRRAKELCDPALALRRLHDFLASVTHPETAAPRRQPAVALDHNR